MKSENGIESAALKTLCALALALCALSAVAGEGGAPAPAKSPDTVKAEHDALGNAPAPADTAHSAHPDAQWYPDAGLGLFIHWSPSSVKGINIGWSMIEGLNGRPAQITPNEYWALAEKFNPQKYDPNKWLKAAKDAGFVYAVFTTRHHEGFAMWPSAYGEFNTKNYMGGRDLLKDYVNACRKNGLKVGFYYSPPDWYFERETKNFTRRPNSPPLGPDLKPRESKPTPEQLAAQTVEYSRMIRGQLEELLTKYGKIDLLWFDGRAPNVAPDECMSVERIRELQPGIVLNTRWHGRGDFINMERTLKTDKIQDGWAEYCNTWTPYWPHVNDAPFRAPGFILGQLVTCRSLQVNYLPGVGPTLDGEFVDGIYQGFAAVRDWMKINAASIKGTKALSAGESASVPATSLGSTRYLFALPKFKDNGANDQVYEKDLLPAGDVTLTLKGVAKPASVKLLGDKKPLEFSYADNTVTVQLPAAKRTKLVDVVQVELK